MTDSILFRIDLDGTKVPVKWREMHEVRRDILHYFEENLHEPTNVYVIPEYSKHEYWKYLTVCYEREYAETRRYCWLFERGCLALLNGLSLDILNEQLWPGSNLWDKSKGIAESCLPYLKSYQPKEPLLNEGKQMLIEAMSFISAMSADELDENGYPKFVTTDQGGWFTKNIIGDYFRATAQLDFG